MMKWTALLILGLAGLPAKAVCVNEVGHTYGSELDAADHVFVATITQATLVGDAALLPSRPDNGERDRRCLAPLTTAAQHHVSIRCTRVRYA